MLKKIQNLFFHSALIKGSLVVFIGAMIANFGMYLFHVLTGRLLGPVDYGLLVSLISLTYFLGLPVGILALVLVRFVSRERDKEKVATFVKEFFQKAAIGGAVILMFFLLLFPLLRNLVKVDSFWLYLGIGVFSYLGLFVAVFTSSLQGLLKFDQLSFLGIFNSWSKLVIVLLLVFLGFKVGGAILGMVIGTLLTVVLGYVFVSRCLVFKSDSKVNLKSAFESIGSYSLAVFLNNVSLTSLYTVDIILARFFLSPLQAGYYAALSSLGKIIFFASSPIASVMFPLVSSKESQGQAYGKTLLASFTLVFIISFGITCLYFFFPELMVSLLYGKQYLEAGQNLGIFAVFISLYSLSSLLLNFFLSISKTRIVVFPAVMAIVQIIAICIYHTSLNQIILVNLSVSTILFVGLLLYFLKHLENIRIPLKYLLAK